MESKMMMPAAYNVLNEEEMLYTEGGKDFSISNKVLAAIGIPTAIIGVISLVDAVWGVAVTRSWITKNKKSTGNVASDTADTAGRGIEAAVNYASKSILNAAISVVTASNMIVWWPITAIGWLTA